MIVSLRMGLDLCILLLTTVIDGCRGSCGCGDDHLARVVVYHLAGTGVVCKVTIRIDAVDIAIVLYGHYVRIIAGFCMAV